MDRRSSVDLPSLIAVFVGGGLGSAARLTLNLVLPASSGALDVATLTVNTVGSLVLGYLTGAIWGRPDVHDWVRAGVGPGVLGSFTTFSAIAVATLGQVDSGRVDLAVLEVALSLTLGFGAALAGLLVGRSYANSPQELDR